MASRARRIRRCLLLLALCAAGLPAAANEPIPSRYFRIIGRPYQRLIERVADRHNIDRHLFAALVDAESARQNNAVSPKGARGLGQLMPGTARRFGVKDPHDPEDNLDGAAQYLAWLIDRYEGDLELALAAYNAGEGAVDKYGGVPPYAETRGYVRKILSRAGLAGGARRQRPGATDPVRMEQGEDGMIVLTNIP